FVLRIEDTDSKRSTEEAIAIVLDSLRWLGLDWDEGPEVEGPLGPYRQTARMDVYRAASDRFLANGRAYFCYCTPDALEARPSARRPAPSLRAPSAHRRAGPPAALQAPRRGRGRMVQGTGDPRRGARELPGAPRLVLRRDDHVHDTRRADRTVRSLARLAQPSSVRPAEARVDERALHPRDP